MPTKPNQTYASVFKMDCPLHVGMETAGVTDYTNQPPPKHFGWIKCLSQTALKYEKYVSNVHKIGDALAQCMTNHNAKFEY